MGFPIPHPADRRYPVAASSANAAAASAAVATTAGWVYSIVGYTTTEPFIQLHDAAALPANGVVPLLTLPVLPGQWFEFHFPVGIRFYNGLILCNSSTDLTKTIGGATTQFVCGYSIKP
jgi:hypothetical protein